MHNIGTIKVGYVLEKNHEDAKMVFRRAFLCRSYSFAELRSSEAFSRRELFQTEKNTYLRIADASPVAAVVNPFALLKSNIS